MTKDDMQALMNMYSKGIMYPKSEVGELTDMLNLLEVIIEKHKFIHPMDESDSLDGIKIPYQQYRPEFEGADGGEVI